MFLKKSCFRFVSFEGFKNKTYERELSDYENVVKTFKILNKKWNVGIFCLWYPLLAYKKNIIDEMLEEIVSEAKKSNSNAEILNVTLSVNSEDSHKESSLSESIGSKTPRLYGSGMLIVNVPWKIQEQLEELKGQVEYLTEQNNLLQEQLDEKEDFIFIEEVYNEAYPLLKEKEAYILSEIQKEVDKFNKALEQGLKEFDKVINGIERHKEFAQKTGEVVKNEINGKSAFRLYDTFGFPLELTIEIASEKGYSVDADGFNEAFRIHQEKSKAVQKGEFKSGLENSGEMTTKYHTATHLLNAALKLVLGEQSHQMGSNITEERLRFDFPSDHKLTSDEIMKLEEIVNNWIKEDLEVKAIEMSKEKAVETLLSGCCRPRFVCALPRIRLVQLPHRAADQLPFRN